MKNMKYENKSISELCIILNSDSNDLEKLCAEKEIIKRLKNYSPRWEQFVNSEADLISKRNNGSNKYLFDCDSMQEFMETFFMCDNESLLFSEQLMCINDGSVDNPISQEIFNIKRRIESCEDINAKEHLKECLDSIEKKCVSIDEISDRLINSGGFALASNLQNSERKKVADAMNAVDSIVDKVRTSGNNYVTNNVRHRDVVSSEFLTKSEKINAIKALKKLRRYALYEKINNVLEADTFQKRFAHSLIKSERSKLNRTSSKLKESLVNGEVVDYNKVTMERNLVR